MVEQNPLIRAVCENDLAAVKSLVQTGADVNVKNIYSHSTPLMFAVWNNYTDVALFLIDNGSDIEEKSLNGTGTTCLFDAVDHDNVSIIRKLIQKNADVNTMNRDGETPLMSCIMNAAIDTGQKIRKMNLLIEASADIRAKTNGTGFTALHYACISKEPEIIELIERAEKKLQAAEKVLLDKKQEEKAAEMGGPLKKSMPAPKILRFE